ncbi:metallophosphoesterase [Chryseolinea sp. T2]|uniref:metallophosphoesterase n=1 Tax=Chryseolinea sp. T2 TaxID=3129255 RepID=UPI003077B9E1
MIPRLFLTFCFLVTTFSLLAQEFWFWPKYTLGQKAANYPGPRIDAPTAPAADFKSQSTPILFHGEDPTQRITDFVPADKLPSKTFSAELWIVNHVNQPVGALVTVKKKFGGSEPLWLLGVYQRNVIFSMKPQDVSFSKLLSHDLTKRGWRNYWLHIVAVTDDQSMKLYINGQKVGERSASPMELSQPSAIEIEAAAYTSKEPYMVLGNLVKMFHLYDHSLDERSVQRRFQELQSMVEEGKLFPDLFHFNAGPYLNNATRNSVDIVWETDQKADFVIEYGTSVPLTEKQDLITQEVTSESGSKQTHIYKTTLRDLNPETPYFYNIKAIARDGKSIETGVLTFSTAVKDSSSYSFAVMGDTEARPHINDRISKLIWDERPNIVLNVGDLTDGGMKDHKFEWNYEYFQGVNQLASRVAVFPVPGNGEEDLFWYNQYHTYPSKGYYNFKYGNAEFFMLNSNKAEDFAEGGAQYVWLEEQLKKSTAKWKFVAHHHAPYSADEDDYGDSWKGQGDLGDLRIRKIVHLYEKYHVDMVFFGHLHTYQRTLPIANNKVVKQGGVIYVQGGGGGGNLEDFAPSRAWFSAKTYRGHHYFVVTIHYQSLNFKMYDTEGRLKDYLDLTK